LTYLFSPYTDLTEKDTLQKKLTIAYNINSHSLRKETMKKIGFFNALGTVVYISIVATIMQNGSKFFGEKDNFVTPIIVLLLFTLSAITVGGLVLGKPLMLYLEDKRKEAVAMFLQTAGWLAGFTVIAMVISALYR
jgi:hypothetical protein